MGPFTDVMSSSSSFSSYSLVDTARASDAC